MDKLNALFGHNISAFVQYRFYSRLTINRFEKQTKLEIMKNFKKLFYLLLLSPLLVLSQNTKEYYVFENVMLTVKPDKIKQFEKGIAAHNVKFHSDNVYGARVYSIASGLNAGKYVWTMGPITWSDMDNRPSKSGHDDDWSNNVAPYMTLGTEVTYWKYKADLSNFPQDFKVKKLKVDVYDITRFQGEKVMKIMAKVKKVMITKFPKEAFGVYVNEFSGTKEGKDLAYVSFFEKSAWLGKDGEFSKKYDEVFGKGSFKEVIKEWGQVTVGSQSELWVYREDLSGKSSEVNAAQRK